jgi:dihydrofolate reductase
MSRVRVHNFSISLDGFGTDDGLSLEAPFGHAGHRLHEWMFATRFWDAAGTAGVDNAFAERHEHGIGAEIMGAGKFGPPGWQDDPEWRGWWGPNPPFHTPTYVLTHRPRPPLEMDGGTTFHFLDVALVDALAVAREAADGQDVRIGGGPTMLREFLAAGLVDHLICMSWRSRSCSAAASGCGTVWRRWRSNTTWRRCRRRAASPISRSPDEGRVRRRWVAGGCRCGPTADALRDWCPSSAPAPPTSSRARPGRTPGSSRSTPASATRYSTPSSSARSPRRS